MAANGENAIAQAISSATPYKWNLENFDENSMGSITATKPSLNINI